MGLLDDAIREHLDLKRRRGADPTEVERAEQEALGPVRRGPEPAVAEPDADEALALDAQDDSKWDERPEETEDFAVGSEPTELLSASPPHTPPGPPFPEEEELHRAPERFVDASPEVSTPRPYQAPSPERAADETVEYQIPEHEKSEDVLEETPEFLQDTPDHDRLWFEQRPPRDFDFDG